jgi:hypothetical protein
VTNGPLGLKREGAVIETGVPDVKGGVAGVKGGLIGVNDGAGGGGATVEGGR